MVKFFVACVFEYLILFVHASCLFLLLGLKVCIYRPCRISSCVVFIVANKIPPLKQKPLEEPSPKRRLPSHQATEPNPNESTYQPTDRGSRPLHWAAGNGSSDAVERLLSARADPEAQDKYGRVAHGVQGTWGLALGAAVT